MLGCPVGQHIYIKIPDVEDGQVSRPYIPITNDEQHHGFFDIAVKVSCLLHTIVEIFLGDYRKFNERVHPRIATWRHGTYILVNGALNYRQIQVCSDFC